MHLRNASCLGMLVLLLFAGAVPVFAIDRAGPDSNLPYCQQPAKCQPLNDTRCMGVQLPYSSSSLDLVELNTQKEVQEHLEMWKGLINLPKCWSVIQPFLCSMYMPKCENGSVFLPSLEMCKSVAGPCRILAEFNLWPSHFRCDNTSLFRPKCKNDVIELKFNTTGQCKAPMVPVHIRSSYYDGVEGCGVPCDEPMLTSEELSTLRQWATVGPIISTLCTAFTVITFLLDWKSSNKYPAVVVFYINLCFLIVCIAWLYPVLFNSQKDIVCRKDKTLRTSEPSVGENISCVVNFVLVYYFLIACIVWFVIQTYAWHINFHALGKIKSKIDKQGAYFHLAAWSLPLVLTITVMALSKVDASPVFGICFVGGQSPIIRIIFLLVPVVVALIIGDFFLGDVLFTLIRLRRGSKEIYPKATNKIQTIIVKMFIFMVSITLIVFITVYCHIYQFKRVELYKTSFRQYIVCQLGITLDKYASEDKCRMEEHPSVFIHQLQILALFSTGCLMAMWVVNGSSFNTWKRFFSKQKEEKEVKVQKHKIIARAFAKRKSINSGDGRFSITFPSSRQDPVGFDFELDSVGTRGDLSSTWAAALPKFVLRRGALTGVGGGSSSSQRRNSFGSEVSYSVRRVSMESRRHSLDSTVSIQAVELTGVVRKGMRHKKVRHSSTRNTRVFPLENSRRSSTSQESTLGTQILSALSMGSEVPESAPNLKRRTANAGLDSSIDVFAGKLMSQLSPDFNSLGITSDLSESSFTDHLYTDILL